MRKRSNTLICREKLDLWSQSTAYAADVSLSQMCIIKQINKCRRRSMAFRAQEEKKPKGSKCKQSQRSQYKNRGTINAHGHPRGKKSCVSGSGVRDQEKLNLEEEKEEGRRRQDTFMMN